MHHERMSFHANDDSIIDKDGEKGFADMFEDLRLHQSK